MADSYVELQDIPVMRVRADMKGRGPPAAFDALESKLPTLKGRRFYGMFRETPDGAEYFACVARTETDDPERLGLETGVIPGGRYVRRRVDDWEKVVQSGQLPKLCEEMAKAHSGELSPSRYMVEHYRSRTEMYVLMPLKA